MNLSLGYNKMVKYRVHIAFMKILKFDLVQEKQKKYNKIQNKKRNRKRKKNKQFKIKKKNKLKLKKK